ncbi:MAG: TlpA family protein disulfide reductase [Bdellovibrio sp.]|nr:TlpA family protein disulfide reductase [Bdellovibrio sp.]
MKLKLTLLFVVLAGAIVFLVFRKDILSYQSVRAVDASTTGVISNESLLNYFKTSLLVDYRGAKPSYDFASIDSHDRVIVHLWASWCAPCVNEVPDLIAFAKRENVKSPGKTVFITVSLDEGSDDLNKFLKSFPDFDTDRFVRVWDKGGGVSKLLDADRLPMTVMIERGKAEPRVVRGVVDWKTTGF